MKSKKLISLITLLCFLSFSFTPALAGHKTQAEKDRDQERAVNAAIGVVAIVGTLYLLGKMMEPSPSTVQHETKMRKKLPVVIKFGLVPSNTGVYSRRGVSNSLKNQSADEIVGTPALTLKVSW